MKICPVGAKLFHTEGQTDVAKLVVAFAVLRTRLKLMHEQNELTALDTCWERY